MLLLLLFWSVWGENNGFVFSLMWVVVDLMWDQLRDFVVFANQRWGWPLCWNSSCSNVPPIRVVVDLLSFHRSESGLTTALEQLLFQCRGNFLPAWLLSTDQSWGWPLIFDRSELGLTTILEQLLFQYRGNFLPAWLLSIDQSWGWPLHWNSSCSNIEAISCQRNFLRPIRVGVDPSFRKYFCSNVERMSGNDTSFSSPIRVGVDLLPSHWSELGLTPVDLHWNRFGSNVSKRGRVISPFHHSEWRLMLFVSWWAMTWQSWQGSSATLEWTKKGHQK